jgi:hypothetical protein
VPKRFTLHTFAAAASPAQSPMKPVEMVMSASLPIANARWLPVDALSAVRSGPDALAGTIGIVTQALRAALRWQRERLARRLAEYRPDDRLL